MHEFSVQGFREVLGCPFFEMKCKRFQLILLFCCWKSKHSEFIYLIDSGEPKHNSHKTSRDILHPFWVRKLSEKSLKGRRKFKRFFFFDLYFNWKSLWREIRKTKPMIKFKFSRGLRHFAKPLRGLWGQNAQISSKYDSHKRRY